MIGVELGVSSWLRNAEISKGLKLRTKGTKSSIFYVDRTVSHRCRLPLCRACLSQPDIRRGVRGGRWPLGEYCVHREALSSPTRVCGWGPGGMCPFPESQGRSSRVPKLSTLHCIFELRNFSSESC